MATKIATQYKVAYINLTPAFKLFIVNYVFMFLVQLLFVSHWGWTVQRHDPLK